ncbi:MAG: hypothetical protein IBJ11_10730 [Phycisphaerales bacterium]|nr:hypothetical protein [Phycisphaerales bacterium]
MPGQLWLLSLSPPILAVADEKRELPQVPLLWRSESEPDIVMTVAYFYGVWLIGADDFDVKVKCIMFRGDLIEMPIHSTLRGALEFARGRIVAGPRETPRADGPNR